MKKYVSPDKRSKKEKKEYYLKIRKLRDHSGCGYGVKLLFSLMILPKRSLRAS